jgi:hypothetical protein
MFCLKKINSSFPSYKAAVFVGGVCVPWAMYGFHSIFGINATGWEFFFFVVFALMIPLVISCVDLKYLTMRFKETHLFEILADKEDFRLFITRHGVGC